MDREAYKNRIEQLEEETRSIEDVLKKGGICSICGYDDPTILEMHHIAGRQNDRTVIPVCPNCHRTLSNGQEPLKEKINDESMSMIGRFLIFIGNLLMLIARTLLKWGNRIFSGEFDETNGYSC